MTHRPSPLAAQIADLRQAAPVGAGAGGWLIDSVIEIIIACLTRLLLKLEALVVLWQEGRLPPQAATPPRQYRPRAPPCAPGLRSAAPGRVFFL